MTTSTTAPEAAGKPHKPTFPWRKCLAAAFWLAVWQLAAMALGQEILLVSPVSVFLRLTELVPTGDFWGAVGFSFLRITVGFLLACVLGTGLGALSDRFALARELITPLMSAIKSTPVASFIILVLLWVPSRNLSVVISFLMVTPIVYVNILGGLQHRDPQLAEMARVFQVPAGRRLRYLTLPQVAPFFRSACAAGLGLCWKAGVAAEVIGLPKGSIGERLYQAKIYLDTPDLFAWTAVIILVSLVFERVFLRLLDAGLARLERT